MFKHSHLLSITYFLLIFIAKNLAIEIAHNSGKVVLLQ